jgi:methyl coenzyme M reductase subunit C
MGNSSVQEIETWKQVFLAGLKRGNVRDEMAYTTAGVLRNSSLEVLVGLFWVDVEDLDGREVVDHVPTKTYLSPGNCPPG